MGNKLSKASRLAQATESHWSFGQMVKDNWPWIAGVTGLPVSTGWLAWIKATAEGAAWHDKLLFAIIATGFMAFVVLGARAFLLSARRAKREEGAIARGLSISGYTYERGTIIEGGTHTLPEIFGRDQVRTDVTFRNCHIAGPGIVALFACHIERSEFIALPGPHVLDSRHSGEIARFAYRFVHCKFDNCAFEDVAIVGNLSIRGADLYRYKLVRMKDDED
ncbi:hypothetical protein [Sphingopyxis granuli]|uniref:hypothetical protein n=1 Tax=Sphingopyxis granuli TaxID=267128 RepID=UPI00083734A9|nr:hypothetical protein [Sphingopyxis granuli]